MVDGRKSQMAELLLAENETWGVLQVLDHGAECFEVISECPSRKVASGAEKSSDALTAGLLARTASMVVVDVEGLSTRSISTRGLLAGGADASLSFEESIPLLDGDAVFVPEMLGSDVVPISNVPGSLHLLDVFEVVLSVTPIVLSLHQTAQPRSISIGRTSTSDADDLAAVTAPGLALSLIDFSERMAVVELAGAGPSIDAAVVALDVDGTTSRAGSCSVEFVDFREEMRGDVPGIHSEAGLSSGVMSSDPLGGLPVDPTLGLVGLLSDHGFLSTSAVTGSVRNRTILATFTSIHKENSRC